MRKYQCVCMVIYLIHNSLEENVSTFGNIRESNRLIQEGIHPIPEQCTSILKEFAQSAENFTLCSIINAKPIRLCENCIHQYVNFTNMYQRLSNTLVNGTTCQSYFISQDRFDVVLEFNEHTMTVWNKGHCNDCFEFSEGTPSLSNNTLRFNKMAKDTMDCIISNIDPTSNNTDEVCVRCMQSYLKLNEFYGTLSKDSIGVDSVCMDTVDLMNTTRSIWSKTLNCCKMRKSPEIIFLCCTAIISLLPILYYVVVRYCGPIRDLPNILKESRFKQSILRSTNKRERNTSVN